MAELSIGTFDAEEELIIPEAAAGFQGLMSRMEVDVLVATTALPYDMLSDQIWQETSRHLSRLGYVYGKFNRQLDERRERVGSGPAIGMWSRLEGKVQNNEHGMSLSLPDFSMSVFAVAYPQDAGAQAAAALKTYESWCKTENHYVAVIGLCRAAQRRRRGLTRPLVASPAMEVFARNGFSNADASRRPLSAKGVEPVPAGAILLGPGIQLEAEGFHRYPPVDLGEDRHTRQAPISAFVSFPDVHSK